MAKNIWNKNYNTLDNMPQMPYKIISEILMENQNIWKLLKYETNDALDQSSLTLNEKRALIFNGEGNERDYRVFTQIGGIDESFDEHQTQLRVDIGNILPENPYYADIHIDFLCTAHGDIMTLNNYQNRTARLMQEVISTINGIEIGGIGKLVFDRMRHESVMARNTKINNFFWGRYFHLSVEST